MPLKALQHQGPVQMSGCCDTSQKEAVSQWNPGGQCRHKLKDTSINRGFVYTDDLRRQLHNPFIINDKNLLYFSILFS